MIPNGAKLFQNNQPRLTVGGFVGSAKIDPRYALKVKNENVYVDIRDFIPNVSTSRDRRKRHAWNTLTHIRRREYMRSLAKAANVPTKEVVLAIPNAVLNAQVSEVKHHLIGTTKENFADVQQKALSGMTVQVVDSVTQGGITTYTTYEVDPMECSLIGFDPDPAKNWVERNEVYLSVPVDVALAALPEKRRAAYETHRSQFPNGGLVAPISGSNMWAPFDRGFTEAYLPVTGAGSTNDLSDLIRCVSHTECVVAMHPLVSANGGQRKFYVVDDLSDLMVSMQSMGDTTPNGWWDTFKKVVGPTTDLIIRGIDTFLAPSCVSRNGYSLRDMENVVFCKNFAEVCSDIGYASIPAMLESVRKTKDENFLDFLFECIPVIGTIVNEIFYTANPKEKKILDDGEIDYSDGGYPFSPDDINVVSRSTSGIGASGSQDLISIFPPNNDGTSEPIEETVPPVTAECQFSIGNSVQRYIQWELSADFVDVGGTKENVGEFLQYSMFDFSRIDVFLVDSLGFCVPCNTDVVSVHGFDSTVVGRGTAVLEYRGQGSTTLTVSFPYTIVPNKIRTCLASMSTTDILVGSEIDPTWITTAVCDSLIDGSGEYKNVCALTPNGFDLDPVDTSTPGWKNIVLRPRNTETPLESSMRVRVVQPDLRLYVEDREVYDLQAYLSPEKAPSPGVVISPSDIRVRIKYNVTNAPVFTGTAQDLMRHGFVSTVTLNGGTELKLVEGANTFTFLSRVDDVELVAGKFTEKIVREVAEVTFVPRSDMWFNTCLSLADAVSGVAATTDRFICTVHYADGSTKVVEPDEYSLEIVYPPSFVDEDKSIAEIRVRPVDIDGYDSVLLSGSMPSCRAYASEDQALISKVGEIQSVEYRANRLPWIGEFPNPNDFVVMVAWSGADNEKYLVRLHPSAYSVLPYNSTAQTTTAAYASDSDSVIVHWGTKTSVLPITIARDRDAPIVLGSIEATPRKGKTTSISYGTKLTMDFFEVTGVSADEKFRKVITDNVHIKNYYPAFSGSQDISLVYGVGDAAKECHIEFTVKDPEIVSVTVTPRSTVFEMGEKLSPSDCVVTATTGDGLEMQVPTSQVRIVEFDTGFIGDQTFMGTVECVGFDDSPVTGSMHAASFRFDVGLGGDETRYTTPALVCRFSKPYCFVGDRVESLSDIGFEGAFVVGSDGTRHAVEDPQNLHMDRVDTSKAGTVFVDVEYTHDI